MFEERAFYCHGREIVQKRGGILFVNDFLLFTEIKFIFLDFSKNFLLLLLPLYFITLTCYRIMIHEASHILQRFCGVHHQ